MSSTVTYDFSDWNNALAAIVILVNSCLGLSFNLSIIWSFMTDKQQRNSFNVICFFRAINNVFVLGYAFLAVFLPAIVLFIMLMFNEQLSPARNMLFAKVGPASIPKVVKVSERDVAA
ncbi:unnamed protein product [Caenorhabditis brenneri]